MAAPPFDAELAQLFDELKEHWDAVVRKHSTAVDERRSEELLIVPSGPTALCFFALPARRVAPYRQEVFPVAEEFGLVPITPADVISSTDNVLAKISAIVTGSSFLVADLTDSNPNVLQEISIAQRRNPPVQIAIVLAENQMPADIRDIGARVIHIQVSDDFQAIAVLLRDWFAAVTAQAHLTSRLPGDFAEADRLLAAKEATAAVIAAFRVFESQLKDALAWNRAFDARGSGLGVSSAIREATHLGLIPPNLSGRLQEHLGLRNRLVHSRESARLADARKVVRDLRAVASRLPRV